MRFEDDFWLEFEIGGRRKMKSMKRRRLFMFNVSSEIFNTQGISFVNKTLFFWVIVKSTKLLGYIYINFDYNKSVYGVRHDNM